MFDLKKIILDSTEYISGYINIDDDYVISASMIGKDPLQNYLSILHGKIHADEITDSTLGSIFHIGMEKMIYENTSSLVNYPILTEKNMSYKLSNGWILSGTADLLVQEPNQPLFIRDYKLTKSYALKMFKKDPQSHQYTKQLNVLDLLAHKTKLHKMKQVSKLWCDFFLKDAKAVEYEKSYNPQLVPNVESLEVLEEEIIEQTDILQAYIEKGEVPPQCEDLWLRNVKGKVIPMRCAFYCNYNKVCPYYESSSRTTIQKLANW